MYKKITRVYIYAIGVIFFLIVGCEKNNSNTDKITSQLSIKDTLNIGIVSVVDHPSLDSARFGFIETMNKFAKKNNKKIFYSYQSANLSRDKEVSVISTYIGDQDDLILTIGTSPTQTAKNLTERIPVVFAAVTNPGGDKIVNSLEKPGANVTGASDLYPVKEQLALIKEFFPNTKKVGFIYNKGETNSVYIVELAEKYSNELGISIVHATAERTVDVQSAVSSIIKKIDALVMPTDNTAAAAVLVIGNICLENNVPFFSTELESVKKGLAIASTYSNYTNVGKEAGKIAVRIIQDETPGHIPVKFLDDFELVLSKKLIDKYQVTPSDATVNKARIIE